MKAENSVANVHFVSWAKPPDFIPRASTRVTTSTDPSRAFDALTPRPWCFICVRPDS